MSRAKQIWGLGVIIPALDNDRMRVRIRQLRRRSHRPQRDQFNEFNQQLFHFNTHSAPKINVGRDSTVYLNVFDVANIDLAAKQLARHKEPPKYLGPSIPGQSRRLIVRDNTITDARLRKFLLASSDRISRLFEGGAPYYTGTAHGILVSRSTLFSRGELCMSSGEWRQLFRNHPGSDIAALRLNNHSQA